MDIDLFTESVKRTWKGDARAMNQMGSPMHVETLGGLAHALIGISSEAGELLDEYKKWRFYNDGRSFPQNKLEEELGDVLYYVFAACMELEIHPIDLMNKNKNKLKERYATYTGPPNCSWSFKIRG